MEKSLPRIIAASSDEIHRVNPCVWTNSSTYFLASSVNQHPPAQDEGWMISGPENSFLWGSYLLANHDG
jgi:hypothetical protein